MDQNQSNRIQNPCTNSIILTNISKEYINSTNDQVFAQNLTWKVKLNGLARIAIENRIKY